MNADGWVVERIGDGIEPPAGFPAPTIELDADGSARVFTGCNQGRGSFEFGDGSILFGPLRLTRMACPPPLTEIESTLLVVLDGPLDVEWDGDALVLVRGDLRVRLRRH